MGRVILETRDLHSGYEDVEVLRGLTLQAQGDQITVIIGPNGAGKSTLLKTVFGLLTASAGHVYFNGHEITNKGPLSALRLGLGYVPQGRTGIFPLMTVRENLEMGGYSRTSNGIDDAVAAVMSKFPILHERRNQLAGNLSGGEQQLLAMGMSLLIKPRLLLLDEPSLGLSPKMTDLVFAEIQRIHAEGAAIVMVEQNATRALRIADKALVLELGQKRFEGSGVQLLENPEVRRLYTGR